MYVVAANQYSASLNVNYDTTMMPLYREGKMGEELLQLFGITKSARSFVGMDGMTLASLDCSDATGTLVASMVSSCLSVDGAIVNAVLIKDSGDSFEVRLQLELLAMFLKKSSAEMKEHLEDALVSGIAVEKIVAEDNMISSLGGIVVAKVGRQPEDNGSNSVGTVMKDGMR